MIITAERSQAVPDPIYFIMARDKLFAKELQILCNYLASTYDDKYNTPSIINTMEVIYSDEHGKGYNIGNACKYLQRYMTKGFEKSENPKDLQKAIHYILFELTRKAK